MAPEALRLSEAEILLAERRAFGCGPQDLLAALCLSGGGIRSAAFCLGALQALARHGLLTEFHYLSTVSGGGYVGGWLTRWIGEVAEIDAERMAAAHDAGAAPAPSVNNDVQRVQDALAMARGLPPEQVGNLRRFTNFLVPESSLVSDDAWAGVVLWLRNTIINWLVFGPLLLSVAALPVGYLLLVNLFAAPDPSRPLLLAVSGLALGALGYSVFRTCIHLPSHGFTIVPETRQRRMASGGLTRLTGLDGRMVRRLIIHGAAVWAACVPLLATPWLRLPALAPCLRAAFITAVDACPATPFQPGSSLPHGPPAAPPGFLPWLPPLATLPLCAFLVCLLAFLAAALTVWLDHSGTDGQDRAQLRPFLVNIPAWMVSCAASAGLLWLGQSLAQGQSLVILAVAGPLWVMTAETIRTACYVALRTGGLRTELDREWLARLNAVKLRGTLVYCALAAVALLLPPLVLDTGRAWAWVLSAAGFAAGPVAALLGKSGLTQAVAGAAGGLVKPSLNVILGVAAVVFAVSMVMFGARLDADILLATLPGSTPVLDRASPALHAALLIVASGAAGYLIGLPVNLNRFSMHGVYRNRLVRAFLGSARPFAQRRPDAFTGFDPRDDVRVADTFRHRACKRLFPVINVAMNQTVDNDPARAERKAASFTISPLHCGSAALGAAGRYVETGAYAGDTKETGPDEDKGQEPVRGIRLGTAMTISGAAASPDMGYRSSPYAAFIMTLFNVRLGAWMPNPDAPNPTPKLMLRSGPLDSVSTLLNELLGRASVDGNYVYLSDGGHFDNLGLYEMLRRRCALILVIDGGCDPQYHYADLGQTLQKASLDLNVTIRFKQPLEMGNAKLPPSGAHAQITYPPVAGEPGAGQLLYLKAWKPADMPASLSAYGAAHTDFPHDTTLNQFFTESDFESYRALGDCIAAATLTHAAGLAKTAHATLRQVFTAAAAA